MGDEGEIARGPIFRDIRRYYCDYCGICRSKKSLINSHMLAHHPVEMKEKEQNEEKGHGEKLNVCVECGASFRKPAHLKQHMQSHSLEIDLRQKKHCPAFSMGVSIGSQIKELQNARGSNISLIGLVPGGGPPGKLHQRPFTCTVDDCNSSYRRKDHLTRHMLQHQGKFFECPAENCRRRFTVQGNLTRHVKEFHDESAANVEHPKEYVCAEPGCGKVFKYLSKLHKHEDSHVKLDSVEAFCAEPGCMKYFSNEKCLKEHIWSCHQYIDCDICGSRQLKKNIKRHLRMHDEVETCSERIKCSVEGCLLTFSNTSNLKQHIKAVHLELKPFTCSIPGCNMKFAFKHVRDKHEQSGGHVFTPGDFEESDEQFRSRPRGGRKRTCPVIETLMRKRVVPPTESELVMNEGHNYASWLHSPQSED